MSGELKDVLVVDDSASILQAVKLGMEQIGGIPTRTCSSGSEALGEIGSSPPQLILLDSVMPEMDGAAVLERLRDDPKTAALPVVFLTGEHSAADLEKYSSLGYTGLIEKPFDPMTLAERVKGIWNSL